MRTFVQEPKPEKEPYSGELTKPGRPRSTQDREVDSILHLQQTIGNQAVQRLLQSQGKDHEADADRNTSTSFAHDSRQVPADDKVRGNVQPKLEPNATGDAMNNALDIHEAALSGLSGKADPLPYLATIQQSFGRHDVTAVEAHVGGAAREANERMGASAYTTGKSVAFRQAPDMRTAAHEAAHIIQQRAGVQLTGGVGQSDDHYEQEADAVADTVVQGRSAESLLDRHPGSDAVPSRQVQLLPGGPYVTGPPAVGSCTLRSGTMQWSLVPMPGTGGGSVNVRIEFTPNPAVAGASKTISFIQTVSETSTSREGVSGFFGFGTTTRSQTQVDAGSYSTGLPPGAPNCLPHTLN